MLSVFSARYVVHLHICAVWNVVRKVVMMLSLIFALLRSELLAQGLQYWHLGSSGLDRALLGQYLNHGS